jgi:hypothetical protein
MGEMNVHKPVLLIVASFSRHEAALDWARDTCVAAWGPVALESDRFDFTETGFYERSMGAGLKKMFLAFERLVDPAALPELKLQTNDWECDCQQLGHWPEARPLNLDPGYVTEAKLVLASTKDRDHRLYLGRGIYGEVTLHFHRGAWCKREWTYPDYQRDDYHQFLTRCREYLRGRYRAELAK